MKYVIFSTSNKPDSWDTPDHGVITFASEADAKKAEAIYRQLSGEINRLRSARPEETALLAAFDSGVHAGYMSNGESDRQRFRQQFLESLKRHEPQKREG